MKTKTQFRSLCAAAWRIIYRHPVLWFYGLISSFVTYQWFHAMLLGQLAQVAQPSWLIRSISGDGSGSAWFSLLAQLSGSPATIIVASSVLAITLLALFIGSLAEVALIRRITDAQAGIITREHTVSLAGRAMPVLMITVIARILQYAAFIILHLPLLYALSTDSAISAPVAALAGITAFLVIAMAIQGITSYTIVAIAHEELSFGLALSRGFELFSARIGRVYAATLWLLLVRAGFTLLLVCLAAVILLPFGSAFLVIYTSGSVFWAGVLAAAYFICVAFLFVLARALYSSYYVAVWVLAYQSVAGGSLLGSLARTAARITSSIDLDRVRGEIGRAESAAERAYTAAKPVVQRAYRAAAPVISREAKRAFGAAVAAIEKKQAGKKSVTKKSSR